MGSKKFTLDMSDLLGVGRNALLVGGAAALTCVAENLHVVNLGMWGPAIVPVFAVVLDTAIKWMKNNKKEAQEHDMEFQFDKLEDLVRSYEKGFEGAVCDPEETKTLLAELQTPLFGATAYDLYGAGEGKLSLPYMSLLKFDKGFGPAERQTTGDCVSHAFRNAIDVTRAVEIDVQGEAESFVTRGATEGIYQSRGDRGQGMTCSRAARYVNKQGGILLRQKYPELDLTNYNSSLGANLKIPHSLFVVQAQKHQVKTVSMIKTVEEARDALANGYAFAHCSMLGFDSKRDSKGITRRKGQWAHAMACIGCDDTKKRHNKMLFLIQNSWGKWNGGTRVHNQPHGSFWVTESDMQAILSHNGSWVMSNVDGFPAKKLPNYGTNTFL